MTQTPAAGIGALLGAQGPERLALWRKADAVRRDATGDTVHVRALLEFSNRCRQDCRYCGLRRSREDLPRYAMPPADIVRVSLATAEAGFGTIVLQSGEDAGYERDTVAGIVRAIKAGAPELQVTLSVGERSFLDYRAWRRAGADRYLLKHETADPALYAALRPGHRLSQRIKRAQWLAGLGYAVGLGNMVGLPGQGPEALVADLELLAQLEPEMVASGPFLPHPCTPLAGARAGDPYAVLNFIALARLALPRALIPASTALATALPGGRELALRAGANVVMVNVGPRRTRPLYEIYPARDDGSAIAGRLGVAARPRRAAEETLVELRGRVVAWLAGQGRVPDALGEAAL